MMKRFFTLLIISAIFPLTMFSQGWPTNYGGVMLQGFYWDSFEASAWSKLEERSSDMKGYVDLLWIPQSADCGGTSMGYDALYWLTNYNSSFGTEQQLRSLIATLKANGIGTIADVVVNHRKTPHDWFTFPEETYKGVTYRLLPSDICANDDGGATAAQAAREGKQLSGNNDTGQDWQGMRDLDHNSLNVQNNVKVYLNMLLNDLGYAGFRYDMVKGYSSHFTGIYNAYAQPKFSVGEYWDGNPDVVKGWINGTKTDGKIQSAAFDFPFRYTLRDAINNNDWSKLSNSSIVSDGSYKRYSVTFVENHDTEYRSAAAQQDPIRRDTLAANAFMIAMPGTPCIFYKHWLNYQDELKAMIDARKLAGITNTSSYSNFRSARDYFANSIQGNNGKLLVVVGDTRNVTVPTSRWTKIISGHHYDYYLEPAMETVWADKPSGNYTANGINVTLTAISQADHPQIVYTTDGSMPNAGSSIATSGSSITIPTGETTLKMGLLKGTNVTGIVTRTYNVREAEAFDPYTITVYVNGDLVGWNNYVNFYTWGEYRNAMAWPGERVDQFKMIDGKKWFYKSYQITKREDYVNFVFSNGNASTAGNNQTIDIKGIKEDTFFDISTTKSGNKYTVNITSGIENTINPAQTGKDVWYTLQGIRINQPVKSGVYIHQGRKVIKK